MTYSGVSVVGSKVSGELFTSGLLALGVAIVLMFAYIWFRFEPQFGFGAVAGLLHDVILTFGLIVLFKLEFSLNMVAAILTVIGYSMNDTVVVFDRLRENLRKYKTMPLRDVIDLSLNETLSRTIITGVTAVMVLAALAFFGGEALFGFSIALMFGIIVGTYSSIYVGAPIILLWGVKRGRDRRGRQAGQAGHGVATLGQGNRRWWMAASHQRPSPIERLPVSVRQAEIRGMLHGQSAFEFPEHHCSSASCWRR